MSTRDDKNTVERTETESHKSVETKQVDGKITTHEEEETKKRIRTETDTSKILEKTGGES